jgi:hypothetical protein
VREHYVLTWPSSRVGSGYLISGTNLTEFFQKRFDLDPIVKNSGSDRVLNTILVSKQKCFASENLRRNLSKKATDSNNKNRVYKSLGPFFYSIWYHNISWTFVKEKTFCCIEKKTSKNST